MATQADWFAKTSYKAKYEFMARVEGKYKGIPFVGSVGNDTLISPDIGPVYHIHLDLPMKVGKEWINFIFCKHSEIKGLKRRDKWTE
jgi:hypothetical protein